MKLFLSVVLALCGCSNVYVLTGEKPSVTGPAQDTQIETRKGIGIDTDKDKKEQKP